MCLVLLLHTYHFLYVPYFHSHRIYTLATPASNHLLPTLPGTSHINPYTPSYHPTSITSTAIITITIHVTSHCARHSPFTRYSTMNAFPNGTRVFYWDVNGTIKYGTVESTSRMGDGTQVINVRVDGGSLVSLPVSSVSKVT